MATGTFQQALGSIPIKNVVPPPEGNMGVSFTATLTPTSPSIAQGFQLNSQSGLMMSQIMTLCVDNSANNYPIIVTHGAFNESVQIAAFATSIIPTFSNASNYAINIAVANAITPTSNLVINVIFLNYPRQPGTFSTSLTPGLSAAGQNSTILSSVRGSIVPNSSPPINYVSIYPLGYNLILDSLRMSIAGINQTTVGFSYVVLELCPLANIGPSNDVIENIEVDSTTATAGFVSTSGNGIVRTWPQGLLIPRGCGLCVTSGQYQNVNSAVFSCSVSGILTP